MVLTCCVYGCKETYLKNSSISFHFFPKDPTRRKLWAINLRRKNFVPTDYTRICSKHFSEDCFDKQKFGGRWLKPTAVPTLFDFQAHLYKTTTRMSLSSSSLQVSPKRHVKKARMSLCCVPRCPEKERRDGLSFHLFPRNRNLKEKWCQAIGGPTFKPDKCARICINHFTKENIKNRFGKTIIKNDAVPSIFPSQDCYEEITSHQIERENPEATNEMKMGSKEDKVVFIKDEVVSCEDEIDSFAGASDPHADTCANKIVLNENEAVFIKDEIVVDNSNEYLPSFLPLPETECVGGIKIKGMKDPEKSDLSDLDRAETMHHSHNLETRESLEKMAALRINLNRLTNEQIEKTKSLSRTLISKTNELTEIESGRTNIINQIDSVASASKLDFTKRKSVKLKAVSLKPSKKKLISSIDIPNTRDMPTQTEHKTHFKNTQMLSQSTEITKSTISLSPQNELEAKTRLFQSDKILYPSGTKIAIPRYPPKVPVNSKTQNQTFLIAIPSVPNVQSSSVVDVETYSKHFPLVPRISIGTAESINPSTATNVSASDASVQKHKQIESDSILNVNNIQNESNKRFSKEQKDDSSEEVSKTNESSKLAGNFAYQNYISSQVPFLNSQIRYLPYKNTNFILGSPNPLPFLLPSELVSSRDKSPTESGTIIVSPPNCVSYLMPPESGSSSTAGSTGLPFVNYFQFQPAIRSEISTNEMSHETNDHFPKTNLKKQKSDDESSTQITDISGKQEKEEYPVEKGGNIPNVSADRILKDDIRVPEVGEDNEIRKKKIKNLSDSIQKIYQRKKRQF